MRSFIQLISPDVSVLFWTTAIVVEYYQPMTAKYPQLNDLSFDMYFYGITSKLSVIMSYLIIETFMVLC